MDDINEDEVINAFMGVGEQPKSKLPGDRQMPPGWERFYPKIDSERIANETNTFLNALDQQLSYHRTGIASCHYFKDNTVLIKIHGDHKIYFFYNDGITSAWGIHHN